MLDFRPDPPPAVSWDQWCRLIVAQHGVLAHDQLRALGVSKGAIAANVAAGRWRRVWRGVIWMATGPLPRLAAQSAALLYAGPTALLSHRTAAEDWGMVRVGAGPVHLTVPYRCSAISQLPDLVLHRSRAFEHIAVATDPPRTSRADTVLDLAVSEPDARAAMRCFVALAAQGRVPVRDLQRRMAARPPRRYRRALADALALLAGGVQSALEQRYACDVERAHGLPSALRQAPLVVDGRTLWEDAVYDHLGIPLTVRLDGRHVHSVPEIAFRDRRRDNAGELARRHRLSFGWPEVDAESCQVAVELFTVLRREGWHGPVRPCENEHCALVSG